MNEVEDKNPSDEGVVYQHKRIRIVVKKVAGEAAIHLLKQTVYGTNGVRYQHTGQEQKVRQLHNPYFFHLLDNEQVIGIYCLDERQVDLSDGRIASGFYGRYLAVAANQQGKGYGHLLKTEAVRYVKKHADRLCVFYSYIEEKNTRSLRISKAEGFHAIATLRTFVFRRYSPKIDPRFARLPIPEQANLFEKLGLFYKNHTLKTFAQIGYQTNYFILKEKDEILAGVQANPVCWKFSAMPNVGGWFMMNIFPLFSATRRFFDPATYRFLAMEGIYMKTGSEKEAALLLESVLAHFGCHSALLQIDTKDPLNMLFADAKQMGRLSGFQKGINTHVMVKTLPEEQLHLFNEQPVYVSSFDFT